MIIRKLRIQRAWSQEQLAELSGLSIRTVQRVEQGQAASLETLKSLAAVFEVNVTDLQKEPAMQNEINTLPNQANQQPNALTLEERQAFYRVKKLRGFYTHAMIYVIVITGLTILNALQSTSKWWVLYTIAGWGIGLIFHAIGVFGKGAIFGPEWEKRQVEKQLGRKL